MTGRVVVEIINGQLAGRRYEFTEHDVFIFGRNRRGCHAAIPGDRFASRNHFILEVNPPDAQLRDLGSLNGTHVNGIKHGGREIHETPQEGALRFHSPVPLHSGDLISVGDTKMRFQVELPIDERDDIADVTTDGPEPADPRLAPTLTRRKLLCLQCGQNVAKEVGLGRTGEYVCVSCQNEVESDPMRHLKGLIQDAVKPGQSDSTLRIPGYKIFDIIGKGGMGVVYRAESEDTREEVAVKTMLSRIAVDPRAKRTFLRECDVLRNLKHPNIVRLIESTTSGSAFYFIMEYCSGGSVERWWKKQKNVQSRKIGVLMLQTLSGLAFAHRQGFVHRDIKPQNILLHQNKRKWRAMLGDFGLAKSFEKAGFSGMTATGSFAGTYDFMPREQLTDYKRTRPVSDLWSLGATFYYLLTGDSPRDRSPDRLPEDVVLDGEVIPIRDRNPQISNDLARVIDRAVAIEPSDRFQSAETMHRALSRVLSTKK